MGRRGRVGARAAAGGGGGGNARASAGHTHVRLARGNVVAGEARTPRVQSALGALEPLYKGGVERSARAHRVIGQRCLPPAQDCARARVWWHTAVARAARGGAAPTTDTPDGCGPVSAPCRAAHFRRPRAGACVAGCLRRVAFILRTCGVVRDALPAALGGGRRAYAVGAPEGGPCRGGKASEGVGSRVVGV